MKKTLLILSVSAGLLFTACGNPKTVETEDEGKVAEATVESVTYNVSTSESTVEWKGSKFLGSSHTGSIALTSGSLSTEGDVITAGNFTLDMNSIEESNPGDEKMAAKLVGHLKSGDFFMVDSFSTANFEITEGSADKLKGNLTIKGITKQIEIPVTTQATEAGLTASSQFTINRQDWGVVYGTGSGVVDNAKDDYINDAIEFTVNLVATK